MLERRPGLCASVFELNRLRPPRRVGDLSGSSSHRTLPLSKRLDIVAVMILPGLAAIAFYRRRPTTPQIALGLAFTAVVSGLLGYWQDAGTSRVWDNVVLAIIGGVVLYGAILAYLVYVYLPKRARTANPSETPPSSP